MDALRSFLIKNDAFLLGRREMEKPSVFLAVIGFVVFLSFLWAAFFHIDRVVRVEGKVIPTGHSRPIQHLEGGIVSEILTAEGKIVHKGDLLLMIDATSADADLNETKIKLMSERARAIRLKAEAGQEDVLKFPDDLEKEKVSTAERELFLSRKAQLSSALDVHKRTIGEHQASLTEVEKRSQGLAQEVDVAHKRVVMMEAMAARKAAAQMEVLEAQSREKRLVTELQSANDEKPKIQAALATERARVAAISADFQTDVQKDLSTSLAEIDRLNQILTTAADRVSRTEIRAPIDGTINRMGVASVGEVVKPGETIIELTPTSQEILIEAHVFPKDRGELQNGIDAKVRVTAYDFASLGVLSGKLEDISADTMVDSRGEPYYRAKIHIGKVTDLYAGHPILPGMPVLSDLVIGQRSVLAHFLSPLRKFTNNMFRDSR